MKTLLPGLVLVALACGPTLAQTVAPVQITAHVDHAAVGLGKTVQLTVDVSYPPSVKVALPAADSLRFAPFEVRDAVETPLPDVAGRKQARYTVHLANYQDGKATVPPFRVDYVAPNGAQTTAQSEPISIEVERAAGASAKADIHGLKPLAAVVIPRWLRGLELGAAALGALALLMLLRRIFRRRSASKTAHGLALAALDRLMSEDLPSKGKLKLHYDRLAEILRAYLARRFELPVMEHTTGEVVTMMESRGFDESLCAQVGPVLQESDLVKFARLQVAPDHARVQVGIVRGIVESTRPVEQGAKKR
jgi:hypothetical protein